MMDNDSELLSALLLRMEGDDLDFKREQYHLESDDQKLKFVKDILCMANLPKSRPAYIVIGVEAKNGRVSNIIPVPQHPDPATFQRLVQGHSTAMPEFSYRTAEYRGMSLGLLEFPPSRHTPIQPRSSFGVLHPGTFLTRRNGENAEADSYEVERMLAWAKSDGSDSDDRARINGSWGELFRACHGFASERVYVAVLGEAPEAVPADWNAFVTLGWHLVIDYDQHTDTRGGYEFGREELAKRRSLKLSVLDDNVSHLSADSSVWVAARGLESRPSSIQSRTWRECNRSKAGKLADVAIEVARSTDPRPVTVVVFGFSRTSWDWGCCPLEAPPRSINS